MLDHKVTGRWWGLGLLVLAIWTIPVLVDATQLYFFHMTVIEEPPDWILVVGVLEWYVWALLTPLIFWLVRRKPLDPMSPGRLLLYAVGSVATSLLVIGISMLLSPAFWGQSVHNSSDLWRLFQFQLFAKFVLYILTNWLIVGTAHGLLFYGKFRERQLTASRLETQLIQAELQVLRMQLHPHFLFNTLHAISALMHRDVNLADRMVARLGQLLRTTLDKIGVQELPLREELDFIIPYLEIEQARLGPRLQVRLDVDPVTLDALVPSLLLQPLVENAVQHGIACRSTPGEIVVRAWLEGTQLVIEVRDTGAGWGEKPQREGVGLGNTRARLQHLYGQAQRLEREDNPGGGAVIRIRLPFREDPASALASPVESDADSSAAEDVSPRRVNHAVAYPNPHRGR